jgi:hypothetical protein
MHGVFLEGRAPENSECIRQVARSGGVRRLAIPPAEEGIEFNQIQ